MSGSATAWIINQLTNNNRGGLHNRVITKRTTRLEITIETTLTSGGTLSRILEELEPYGDRFTLKYGRTISRTKTKPGGCGIGHPIHLPDFVFFFSGKYLIKLKGGFTLYHDGYKKKILCLSFPFYRATRRLVFFLGNDFSHTTPVVIIIRIGEITEKEIRHFLSELF